MRGVLFTTLKLLRAVPEHPFLGRQERLLGLTLESSPRIRRRTWLFRFGLPRTCLKRPDGNRLRTLDWKLNKKRSPQTPLTQTFRQKTQSNLLLTIRLLLAL